MCAALFRLPHRTQRQHGRVLPWLLVALALAASAWWYFAPQTLPAAFRPPPPPRPANAIVPVYKWRDAKGNVQFTSSPPSDRPFETLRYDPKRNVVPSVIPPPPQPPQP